MNKKIEPIVIKETFNVSTDIVWKAISMHEQMIEWFFENIPAFEPLAGFETRFTVQSEGRQFTHLWEIVDVIPEKLIRYYWRYEEYDGLGYVTFELEEQEGKTLLTLTNEGINSFPQDIPEFKPESCLAGWEYFIKGRLRNYLEVK